MKIKIHDENDGSAKSAATLSRLDSALRVLELEAIHYRETKTGARFLLEAINAVSGLIAQGDK